MIPDKGQMSKYEWRPGKSNMNNCDNKEGGTHHFACDCREEEFRKLEAENKRLREALEKVSSVKHMHVNLAERCSTCDVFEAANAALEPGEGDKA